MKKFLLRTLERAAKTFGQFYLGSWVLAAGLLDTNFDVPNSSAYDLLFTLDNAKAGVVGLALSVFTSLGSSKVGKEDDPSLVE